MPRAAHHPEWMQGHVRWATDYRFGQPSKLVQMYGEQVQKVLSLRNASTLERRNVEEQRAIARHADSPLNTRSPAVQVASLTVRINRLAEHCIRCPRNASARHTFRRMVARRRRALLELRRTEFQRYWRVVQDFGLYDALAPLNIQAKKFGKTYKKGGGI